MSENFAEMFEQSITQMNMRVGEIITGEVVDINRDVVIVNAGLKSEGVIPVEQFYDENGELDVKVGDIVEVALDSFEDGYGESRLSREKAKRARAWTPSRRPRYRNSVRTAGPSSVACGGRLGRA